MTSWQLDYYKYNYESISLDYSTYTGNMIIANTNRPIVEFYAFNPLTESFDFQVTILKLLSELTNHVCDYIYETTGNEQFDIARSFLSKKALKEDCHNQIYVDAQQQILHYLEKAIITADDFDWMNDADYFISVIADITKSIIKRIKIINKHITVAGVAIDVQFEQGNNNWILEHVTPNTNQVINFSINGKVNPLAKGDVIAVYALFKSISIYLAVKENQLNQRTYSNIYS